MKFAFWFVCIVFPLMFLWMLNIPIAAVFTMFAYGIALSVRWLYRKAQQAKTQRYVESRVEKLS